MSAFRMFFTNLRKNSTRPAFRGFLMALLVVGATACCVSDRTPPEPPESFESGEDGPGTFFRRFRKSLKNKEWKYVHLLLSRRTRNCYGRSRLKKFLTETKPGILERTRLEFWEIKSVEGGPTEKTARLLLVHPRRSDAKKWYRMVRENDIWRLDWSLADILQVPRRVEGCD